MNASKTKFFRVTIPKAIALACMFALGFVSAPALARTTTAADDTTLQDVVVKGIEYQPNMLREDGSNLKVKKQLKDAKPLIANSNAPAPLTLSKKAPLLRESARSDDDPDFWIYDSFVTLTEDLDYDGYYSSFRLEFDVDTVYLSAPIYAVIYTSTSDVFTPFYTTEVYNINGDSTQDAIIVENQLVTGFPSNDYELMVMIYDAETDEVVAVTDGTDDADLAILSLESEDYEYVETVEVVVIEHGGALGIGLIAGLCIFAYRRLNV
jgi:hypothetical protein